MMKKYKRIKCKKCGSLMIKPRGIKVLVKRVAIITSLFFLFFTSLIGILSAYNFIVVGIYDNTDTMFSLGGVHSFRTFLQSKSMSDENKTDLTEIASNLTKGCKTEKCKITKVYNHLITFNYDVGADINSLNIWNEKEGDCDEVSNLMIELLKTLGIKGHLSCTITHCWAVFNADKEKVIADVTSEKFEVRK